ncbi:hypothetical protein M9Y10_007484 [Tritrichomonas musculus]|uniref:DUF3447 domain-containing protein n=1 Tax=Tritrichomonas musculus TaxID=1915356 RepID=A0ABR2J1K7_9EUKA
MSKLINCKEKNTSCDELKKDIKVNDQNNQSIIGNQEISKFIEENKELYNNLMLFLEDSEGNDYYFQNLIDNLNKQKTEKNHAKFEEFLQLITSIAHYHYYENLFMKIFQILQYYKNLIMLTFSNLEIFNIFQRNKKILLFLFENKIINVDDQIYRELYLKTETNGNRYYHFFYPEIRIFPGYEKIEEIEEELTKFDIFNEKRHKGENDSYICSLIREDLVEEFISYVNQSNISLNIEVIPSIFETHSFLNENFPTLIEYSTFFGSIQIFQYLRMNNIQLKPSLWLYAIHSRNAEMIHLLESLKVQPPGGNYENCFIECMKCHHSEIADYLEDNLIAQDSNVRKNDEVLASIMQYHNYAYFPSNFDSGDEFYYLCSCNYKKLVDIFMKKKEKSIKEMISERIQNDIFYL